MIDFAEHAPSQSESERLVLRDPYPEDAATMVMWRNEATVRAHQPLRMVTVDTIEQDLLRSQSNVLPDYNRERFQWIIEKTEDRIPIGWITLTIRSWEHEIGEIGYSIATVFQGRGYGTEAIRLVLKKIFYEARLYRVEAKCSVENMASSRLLERLGFHREGIMREYFDIQGRRVDHYLYSLLRHEYFTKL